MEAEYEIIRLDDEVNAIIVRPAFRKCEIIYVRGKINRIIWMVEKCNRLGLAPSHIYDVIDDFGIERISF